MHQPVMMAAQQHQVAKARFTAIRPVTDVVCVHEACGRATRETTAAVPALERAAEHAGATVGAWRSAAPDATFLVTSQIRLRLRGEKTLPLGPLPVAGAA